MSRASAWASELSAADRAKARVASARPENSRSFWLRGVGDVHYSVGDQGLPVFHCVPRAADVAPRCRVELSADETARLLEQCRWVVDTFGDGPAPDGAQRGLA